MRSYVCYGFVGDVSSSLNIFFLAYLMHDEMNQEKYDIFLSTRSKELKRTSLNLLGNVFNILSDLYSLGIKVNLLDEFDKVTHRLHYFQ